ncbi:hypothetical protein TEA_000234 [Camellia sinensis var. sinensis]|uniref:Glycosyl transferase CAP10 domain-containing protein n=1 Tax=Camellia sinensis var. sinensis TaxID=542762 RepID=A0A4S4DTZ6_CAMSN|nr:hypothetical protein TEA_000234 [Camellia sinensis var. sinensis]
MLEGARTAHFRLIIVDGKAYVEKYKKSVPSRDLFTVWGIAQLLRLYPGRLPDLEMMFDCNDQPVIKSRDYKGPNAGPPPLFRYCSNRWSLDIVFPDWPETNIKPWKHLSKGIKEGNKRVKWEDRVPLAYWKGTPKMAASRRDLMNCNISDRHNWGALLYTQAKAMGEASSHYVHEDLKMDYVYDYMFHLLNEYARLLKFKSTIPPKAVELCPEVMACAAAGVWKKYMLESLEEAPSDTIPCTLPPPYDPQALKAFLDGKFTKTKQVESWENEYWDKQNVKQ